MTTMNEPMTDSDRLRMISAWVGIGTADRSDAEELERIATELEALTAALAEADAVIYRGYNGPRAKPTMMNQDTYRAIERHRARHGLTMEG